MPTPLQTRGDTGDYFYLVPSPDPAQFSFRVKEHAADFQPTTLPTPGVTYGACKWLKVKPRVTVEGFKNYVYTYCSQDGDTLWFYFGKSKSVEERNTPFRTFPGNRNYPWPAVLEDVYMVKSDSFPQSTFDGVKAVAAPSYFPRYRYRPSVNVSSLIKVEQFLAEVPWSEQELIHDQPVPTDVNATYLGGKVDFPRCLHEKVVFNEIVPGAKIVYGVGMEKPPLGRDPSKMVFPATNFTDWAPFVIEDDQTPVNGLWLRERVTIYPPAPPEVQIQ